MSYTPDATVVSEPSDSEKSSTAALEFRTLKTYIRDVILALIGTKLPKAGGELTGQLSLAPSVDEAILIKRDAGYFNVFNAAHDLRTGFIQWNTTGAIIHGAENGAYFRWDVGLTTRLTLDTNGNLRVGAGTPGSGANTLLFLSNTANSGSNPVNGGHLYVEGGALKYRGSAGTVTTLAPA